MPWTAPSVSKRCTRDLPKIPNEEGHLLAVPGLPNSASSPLPKADQLLAFHHVRKNPSLVQGAVPLQSCECQAFASCNLSSQSQHAPVRECSKDGTQIVVELELTDTSITLEAWHGLFGLVQVFQGSRITRHGLLAVQRVDVQSRLNVAI